MNRKERETGFYHLLSTDGHGKQKWIVGEWIESGDGYCWILPGYDEGHLDSDFDEIGERITRNAVAEEKTTVVKFRAMTMSGNSIIESYSLWEQPQLHGSHLYLYLQDGDGEKEDTGWIWCDRQTLTIIRPKTNEVTEEEVREAAKLEAAKVFTSERGFDRYAGFMACWKWLQQRNK